MKPLKEYPRVRQREGEPRRRWFTSPDMDLYVWFDTADEPIGFQFCYDKGHSEHALTWFADRGFSHMRIDAGEPAGALHHKHSPVLTLNGIIDIARIETLFRQASDHLPEPLVQFVLERLTSYT